MKTLHTASKRGSATAASILRATIRSGAFCLLLLGSVSCESRFLPSYADFDRTFSFVLDTNGGLTDSDQLTRAQILGQLEIPDDAEIENVTITALEVATSPGTGNVSTGATIQVSYFPDANAAATVADNVAVDLTGPSTIILANTIPTVITNAKSDILSMLQGTGPSVVNFRYLVQGRTPANSRAVLSSVLRVYLTVTFSACYDVPSFPAVFSEFPLCED